MLNASLLLNMKAVFSTKYWHAVTARYQRHLQSATVHTNDSSKRMQTNCDPDGYQQI